MFSRWGGGAALIREPINATILRQSIIIFPICIATELLFKSAPPVSTPLATPCKSCPGRQRDSSSGTPYRFCYAVGFFPSRAFTFNLLAGDESGDNLRVLSKSRSGPCPALSHAGCSLFFFGVIPNFNPTSCYERRFFIKALSYSFDRRNARIQ